MTAAIVLVAVAGLPVWLWRGRRDALIHLVPCALAFPPLIAYAGWAVGWPGGWLSTRVALVVCIAIFFTFRLLRRDFSYRRIPGSWFLSPHLVLVLASVILAVLGSYNEDANAIGDELLSWLCPIAVFLLIAGSRHTERDLQHGTIVLVGVAVCEALVSGFQLLFLLGHERVIPGPLLDVIRFGREDLWFASFRLYGTFPNLGPNFLGAFLMFPTILAFNRAFSQQGWLKVPWLLAALASAAAIVGTNSRGALLALGLGLVMLPIWRRSIRGLIMVIAGIAAIIFLAAQTPVGRYGRAL